ncbi:MAG: GGDEF domain-containing protein, partial [Alphaproteobacteria bacterium]
MKAQDKVETVIRGPQSYGLAQQALDMMQTAKVWPTPLNFELWLYVAGDPKGDLAGEIERLIAEGDGISDEMSEDLATRYLPKQRLNEEIRDTGDQLSRELASVSDAIRMAKQNHE